MAFIVVIGLLFVAVVFFHYLQGLFSATLSAILAVIAAVLAFSWHESVVESVLKGQMANVSHGIVLVALFAIIYLVLRVIFDKAVPAGVTLPQIIDRVGGGLMGLVAATFGLGILTIAAEELPFGSAVAGYTKYDTSDKSTQVVGGGSSQNQSGYNFNELNSNDAGRFKEDDRKQMFPVMPVGIDEIVVNTVAHLSETGSLQGDRPLLKVHPDFLQEIYAQNIGIQTGAKHVAYSAPNASEKTVAIEGLFIEGQVLIRDAMQPSVRGFPGVAVPLKIETVDDPANKTKHRFGKPDSMLLVVRIVVSRGAADDDSLFRFSPGSIRLVARKSKSADEMADYYPIGTLEHTRDGLSVLYADKPDDYLLLTLSKVGRAGVDVVFSLDKNALMSDGDKSKIADGTFIEVKRLVREDLGGRKISTFLPPPPDIAIGVLHQRSQMDKQGFPRPEIVPGNKPTTAP